MLVGVNEQTRPAEVSGLSPICFSVDEGADIRVGEGKAWPHSVPFKFTGTISKVTIELRPRAAAIAIDADSLSANRCEAVLAD